MNLPQLLERFRNHGGIRLYGENFFWLTLEKVTRILIGFFVSVLVVRQLGPEFFGQLNYALSYCAIFSFTIELASNQIVVRELVRRTEDTGGILASALVLRLTGFALMVLTGGIGLLFGGGNGNDLLVLIIGGGYLMQSLQIPELYFQAKAQGKYIALVQFVFFLSYSGGRAFCVWQKLPLAAYAMVEVLGSTVGALMYWYLFTRYSGLRFERPRLKECKYLLAAGWGFLISGALGSFYSRFDQILIGKLLNDTQVGFYSLAVRLVELWYFVPVTVVSAVTPAIINASIRDREQYLRRIGRLYFVLFWGSVGFCLGCVLFGKWVVTLFYGAAFAPAAAVLQIYCWRMVILAFAVLFGFLAANEDLHREFLWLSFSLGAASLILNLVLIPSWGIQGAAMAFIGASLVNNLIFGIFSKKLRYHYLLFLKSIFNFKLFNLD